MQAAPVPPYPVPPHSDRVPRNADDAQRWSQVVDFVQDNIVADDVLGQSPLIRATAEQMVAAVASELFAEPLVDDHATPEATDSTPLSLRRALEFIDAEADRQISVPDIARAANVTVRALQLAFRQHLGTTPLHYLRELRLRRAHEDLCAADPTRGDTVTDIAARWGFYSPGRFSAAYRQQYGVVPSHTLRTPA